MKEKMRDTQTKNQIPIVQETSPLIMMKNQHRNPPPPHHRVVMMIINPPRNHQILNTNQAKDPHLLLQSTSPVPSHLVIVTASRIVQIEIHTQKAASHVMIHLIVIAADLQKVIDRHVTMIVVNPIMREINIPIDIKLLKKPKFKYVNLTN